MSDGNITGVKKVLVVAGGLAILAAAHRGAADVSTQVGETARDVRIVLSVGASTARLLLNELRHVDHVGLSLNVDGNRGAHGAHAGRGHAHGPRLAVHLHADSSTTTEG